MNYIYKTSGTCSSEIHFDIDGDVISNVSFTGGCNGNLKAVSRLVDGQTVDWIESNVKGSSVVSRIPPVVINLLKQSVRHMKQSRHSILFLT